MPRSDPRGHRRYRDWRAAVRQQHAYQQLPCAECRQPIDYTLRGTHPRAWTLGHDTELDAGGQLTPPLDEVSAEHFGCNAAKGARYANHKRRLGPTTKDW